MPLKKELRILGIDDASFDKNKDDEVLVIGVFFRGGTTLDGVVTTHVDRDGTDSTGKLIEMIRTSKFYSQLQFIFLDGVALGGFNIVDIHTLYKAIEIPVVIVMRDYPDLKGMYKALVKIGHSEKKNLVEILPSPEKIGKVYCQWIGTTKSTVEEVMRIACTNSHIPEPIRIAHLIGAGIKKGESSGQA